jgi:DNA-binding beta-propeller fold protein YncE
MSLNKSPYHRANGGVIKKGVWLAVFFIVLLIPRVRPAHAQKINFIKDLSIKSDENDEQKSFLMVEGVDADSRGNIYALAAREYKIQVYSPKGEYLRTIGKKGQGPGELEMAVYILLDKDDNLYVFDYMKSAFVVFNPEGRYIRNISTKGQYREIPDRIVFDSRGNFIIGSDRIRENSFKISRYDKDFNQGEDLYVKDGAVSWLHKGGGVTIEAPRYTPGVIWAIDDRGNIFVCYNKTYDIEVFSPEKKLIRTITRKFSPEKVPQEEIE